MNRMAQEKKIYKMAQSRFNVSVYFSSTTHNKGPYLSSRQKADSVRGEMVDYAREKWPIFFSRFFEVLKLSGRHLLANNISSFSVMLCI